MFKIKINNKNYINGIDIDGSIVTIGNFDGIHLGHLALFKELDNLANYYRQLGKCYKKIVVSFEPLPIEYFFDQSGKERLTRLSLLRDKYLILKELGYIDEFIILRFNAKLQKMEAVDFINEILINNLRARHVVIGHDFRFAKNASGSKDDLLKLGLQVSVLTPILVDGMRVSSSLIRSYAVNNRFDLVGMYLGRNLQYTSRVIYGNQLGRKFGVPTINLCLGKNRPSLWGIFFVYVYIDGIKYNAVASTGKNPTISDSDIYKLEAHLLGIDMNLYGKIATIEFLQFLRPEKKFDNLDILFKQIHQDLADARVFFDKLN
ncbi:MAG: riboflavin biosynthesis protein RibF [Bacteroidia bacterium]|nr:MAG: riboflavin biosynthesis protein RibF [Bacteroidia bacterium]